MSNVGSTHFKPAIGYLRRSTDRQEQSIGDQRRVIEGYAANNGYDVLDYYIDDAISGASSEDRASFLRLIQDAKQRDCPFQFVLVYDIKRFGRGDNDEAGYYRYKLRRNGIEIIYVSENFDGSDTDDLLRPVKQWQARQELKDLSKVTIRGLLSRADGGWWVGGVPPYGYDLAYYDGSGQYLCTVRFIEDGSKQVLDQDGNITRTVPKGERLQFTKRDKSRLMLGHPDRIKLVEQIFNWYVLEGVGYKSIADRLNQAGMTTPMGGRRRTSIEAKWCATTIMTILQNPVYTGDMVWNRLSFAKFHKISNGQAVQTRNFPGHGPSRNGQEDWIVHRNAHTAIITRTRFDQAQLEKMRRIITEEIESTVPQIGEELDQVEVKIREIKQTISNLIENLTSTNREYVDTRLVELKRELAVLESKRLELEAADAKKIEIGRLIDQAVELAGDFKTAFAEGTIEEKRLFLRAFLKGIELDPTKGAGRAMFILLPGMEKVIGNHTHSYRSKGLSFPEQA